MGSYGGLERRKYTRKRGYCLLNYKITQPPEVIMVVGRREVEAVMLDLSEGGLSLATRYDIAVGARVYVRWTLVNPYTSIDNRLRQIEVSAEVVNNAEMAEDEYRLGITFLDLLPGDRLAILDFIKNNQKQGASAGKQERK